MTNQLTVAEILAINKGLSSAAVAEARKAIGNDSEQEVDVVARWVGKIVRSKAPKPAPATSNILCLATIVTAMEMAGVQKENIADALCKAATMAFQNGKPVGEQLREMKQIEQALADLKKELNARLPKVQRNGTIKFVGITEVIACEQIRNELDTADDAAAEATEAIEAAK